jgi:6-pyruvoyltetrahydropterin/6-carboxytetrahydropterin synthase
MSPSAESLAIMFYFIIEKIIRNTIFCNGEKEIKLSSVVVHETDTGYAESFHDDVYKNNIYLSLKDFIFSDAVKAEWHNPDMMDDLIKGKEFRNNPVVQQV